jgi:hypothetical protein
MRFASEPRELNQLRSELSELHAYSTTADSGAVKLAIQKLVPEYQPYLGVS